MGGTAVGPLRLLLVGSIAVPVALFVIVSWVNYRSAFAEAERDIIRTAEVAREHAASVFDSQKLVAQRVDDVLVDMDDDAIRRDESALHTTFRRMIAGLPQVQSFLVLDNTGHALVATGADPVDGAIDYGDRDYFVALRDGKARTFISQVQVSRVDGQLFFGVAHRREAPDGGFDGVVAIAVAPSLFQTFWKAVVGEEGGDDSGRTVTLVKADGQILARYPPIEGLPPKRVSPGPLFDAIARSPESGTYVSRSAIEEGRPERHYAYKKVRGYPVYTVVGRSTAAIVSGWRRTALTHLLFGVPATIALFLVTLTALRRTRHAHAALAQAQDEMRRRRVAEAAALQAQRMEAIGQLTSGVAHDFNNLLTIIIGNFDMIERSPERVERVRRLARSGLTAARRGAELIAKLLAFSRRQMARPEVVDVNRLLRDFLPVLRGAATEVVTIELNAAAAAIHALLDPGQLESAVLNLVANARDAMPAGGTIAIATGKRMLSATEAATMPGALPGRYIRITVSDTGTGMDPAVAVRAFEPFFTTKEVGQGTGLGLSQVYGFCKQAGGYVHIDSAPGSGTTVELLLPETAEQPPSAERRGSDPNPPPRAEAGETVLVVEDEPDVMAMAVENLTELGYATLTAPDAASALRHLASDARIDILFSDVVMPGGMNGVELVAEARRLRPGLRVLLTSGYSASVNARQLPPDVPLLAKPYRRDDLAAKLRLLAVAS
jgi:two-component system NtrC family sensor kinase